MTEDEAISAYHELSGILREMRLDWIVQQVAREIAEGKFEITTLSGEEQDSWGLGPFSRRRRKARRPAEFTKVMPYTQKAMLLALIGAIETLVLSSAAIEEHLARFVSPDQPFSINFRSDDTERLGYSISEVDLSVTPHAAAALHSLLAELRLEIGDVD